MHTHANFHLLIIDPQNDFCDLPAAYLPPDGQGQKIAPSLPVPGAHADMVRLAELITDGGDGLRTITITLDSHHYLDIAHPTFWCDKNGDSVPPFTQITAADVRIGQYVPRMENALPRVFSYLDQLEAAGRYHLMVWPVHCEIGSWGHNVHTDIQHAYHGWELKTLNTVAKVSKGSNPWTEHYSAVRAEVPDPDDASTGTNRSLLTNLAQADRIYIAGEAGSHCVKATTEHIAENFGPAHIGKLILITDCMSPVAGFEQQYHDFMRQIVAQGARTLSAAQALQELHANVRK
ncbi:cysteine hydrolase family protein [Glaciimonas soli]|uniref:Cysteine hydrolase n=1 Tax=Glaciimonas soli TaxID=2590999 RepID=A0A843YWA7_9BURK|nr:cysteine hydrolase [Glaciimonas soli]MQR00866.1 cysteine hydrolase [Glaciimonas soli]